MPPSCADESAIQSLIADLYGCISGSAGQPRDWPRFRQLFFPGARLVRTGLDARGRPQARAMQVEEYIADTEALFRDEGFFEVQVACQVERFGNIAQAFSTYEARRSPAAPRPERRGINSIQLYHDGSRWQILAIAWDNERPGLAVPARYLPVSQ